MRRYPFFLNTFVINLYNYIFLIFTEPAVPIDNREVDIKDRTPSDDNSENFFVLILVICFSVMVFILLLVIIIYIIRKKSKTGSPISPESPDIQRPFMSQPTTTLMSKNINNNKFGQPLPLPPNTTDIGLWKNVKSIYPTGELQQQQMATDSGFDASIGMERGSSIGGNQYEVPYSHLLPVHNGQIDQQVCPSLSSYVYRDNFGRTVLGSMSDGHFYPASGHRQMSLPDNSQQDLPQQHARGRYGNNIYLSDYDSQ